MPSKSSHPARGIRCSMGYSFQVAYEQPQLTINCPFYWCRRAGFINHRKANLSLKTSWVSWRLDYVNSQ